MHLLYLDESGSVHDANQKVFVLAGFSIFERQGYYLSKELEKIAARFDPQDSSAVELHGSPMYVGRNLFRKFEKEDRLSAIEDALVLLRQRVYDCRIFCCVVDPKTISPRDCVEYAFEQVVSRFDQYLHRLHKQKNTQRGILILDKSTYETSIQSLATTFRTVGHQWGVLNNLSEVPLFLDSKASRMVQLADLIAYSVFRKYQHNDDRFYNIIEPCFDREGVTIHGLHLRL